MTVMEQQDRALKEALGDFAQRRGSIYFEQIRMRVGDAVLKRQGKFIAIDALSGEYVFGNSIGEAMDAFRQHNGDKAVAWLVDLDV